MREPSNTVLVLDDEPVYGNLIARAANESGMQATVVSSIDLFKKAFLKINPAMLVLDIVLDQEDVCAAIDFLGAQHCTAPVIFMSGYDYRMRQFVGTVARDHGLHVADTIDKRNGIPRLIHKINSYRVVDAPGGRA